MRAAVTLWLDGLDLSLDEYGDDDTRVVALAPTECLADGEAFTDGRVPAVGLQRARRRLLRARRFRRSREVLPPLNG